MDSCFTPSKIRLRANQLLTSSRSLLMRGPALFRFFSQPLCTLLEGFSLGLLRPVDLEQVVANTYNSQPKFYDPRRYRLPHEERMLPTLKKHCGDRGTLLDAFCGQGREAELFACNGFDVTAIDREGWMIEKGEEYAQEVGFSTSFVVADFNSFDSSVLFDVVYTSCWMYSTVQGRAQRINFIKQCRTLCAKDGMVVLSYVPNNTAFSVAAWVRFVTARFTAYLCGGNKKTEFNERLYTGLFWHHLSDRTVMKEIEEGGLQLEEKLSGAGSDPTFLFLRVQRPTDGSKV